MFSFQFKYFNNTNKPKKDEPSVDDLTKPDGNLELNVGKINIVFLYRFITELLVSISYFEEYVLFLFFKHHRELVRELRGIPFSFM